MTLKEDLIKTLEKAMEIMEMLEEDNDPAYDDAVFETILSYNLKIEKP